MSASQSNASFPGGWNSLDSEILIVDVPGDTTVRPPSPHLLPFLLAAREKVLHPQKLPDEPPSEKPPQES